MVAYSQVNTLTNIDNTIIADYANDNAILSDVDFSKLKQTDVEPINKAICALPEEIRKKVERDLRHVDEMAVSKKIASLFSELQKHGADIPEFRKKRGLHDKAMWALINYPDIFDKALNLTSFHNASGTFTKFSYKTDNTPDLSKKSLKVLEQRIKNYFLDYDGTGEYCVIESHQFDGKQYLIAYPSEYPNVKRSYKNGKLDRVNTHDPFVVVFIFTESGDAVDIYVNEPLHVKRELFIIWAIEIMDIRVIDAKQKPSFELAPFKLPKQDFQIPASSPVKSFTVCGLSFIPVHDPSKSYYVTADISSNKKALYDELDKKGLQPLHINKVWIEATIQDGDKEKAKRFEVSTSCCSLKHDGKGAILRQLLKDVGIDITK